MTTNKKSTSPEKLKVVIELRLAKAYWQQTIYPHIEGRRLQLTEWLISQDAQRRLRQAASNAEKWNATIAGRRFPVQADEIEELKGNVFCEAKELLAEESLKPETLATIAASLRPSHNGNLIAVDAIRIAGQLLFAAIDYLETLPKKPLSAKDEFLYKLVNEVTFDEIVKSAKKDSGQIPFLPGVHKKREDLTVQALTTAVRRYLDKEISQAPLDEEQWAREAAQDARLKKSGMLRSFGKPITYAQDKGAYENNKRECLQHSRISVKNLCDMRWQRFKLFWEGQRNRRINKATRPGKRPNVKEPSIKLPVSAASSPQTAGLAQR